MNKEERIKLRDKLIKKLVNLKIIKKYSQYYTIKNNIDKLHELNDIDYNLYVNEFRTEEEALHCLLCLDDYSNHLCPICQNVCTFYIKQRQYRITCGNKKCKDTIIYSDKVKKKIKETNLNRYGVENVAQYAPFKDKMKQTVFDRYGVDNIMKLNKYQLKQQESVKAHYGVKFALQCEKCRNKMHMTMLKRYGVKYGMQSDIIKKHFEDTMMSRYGAKYGTSSKIIRSKIEKNNIKKIGRKYYHQKNILHYDIWSDDYKLRKFIINLYQKKKSFITLQEIIHIFKVHISSASKRIKSLKLLKYVYIQDSNLELNFNSFLDENNINHIRHHIMIDKNTKKRREIDFLCDGNIGFEINDIASHNIKGIAYYIPKDKYYHQNKSLFALKHNIRLIHIWEWEIRREDLWDKISNWIINIFDNKKIEININNCEIKQVNKIEEQEFLDQYDLDGYKQSQYCYGIYHNDELIELLSFNKTNDNNDEYQILKNCIKFRYNIKNGIKELLNYFIQNYNPNSIIAYCNLDKFNGKEYEELGFELDELVEPELIWCDKNMNYYRDNSLINNIKNKNYLPIYNSGLYKYRLDIKCGGK